MPLSDDSDLVLYYAPKSRAFRALWFLEELGKPYRLHQINFDKGDHKQAEFLKLNPMGKLPTIVDDGTAVAESGAILAWLADKYSAGVLAPRADDPLRTDYLRWLFFAAGVMEPAFGEKFFKWDVPSRSAAWGNFADMERVVTEAVSNGTWLLGEKFTSADVYVGSNLHWGVLWKLFPEDGPVAGYVARCAARPALKRALAIEERFIKEREASS